MAYGFPEKIQISCPFCGSPTDVLQFIVDIIHITTHFKPQKKKIEWIEFWRVGR